MKMELGRSGCIVFDDDDDDVNATIHLDYILGWIEISVEEAYKLLDFESLMIKLLVS